MALKNDQKKTSFGFRALLLISVAVQSQPTPPIFPLIYDTIQISVCQFESIYCPPAFVNQTITSHSYYDYPALKMLGVDANDVSSSQIMFAADETFVFYNGTHARTEIYGFPVNSASSNLSCVYTEYVGSMLPPNVFNLPGAKFMGYKLWNNLECQTWALPPVFGGILFYVTNDKYQQWTGFSTPDESQIGYFLFFRERPSLPSSIFSTPQNVPCTPLGSAYRQRRRIF